VIAVVVTVRDPTRHAGSSTCGPHTTTAICRSFNTEARAIIGELFQQAGNIVVGISTTFDTEPDHVISQDGVRVRDLVASHGYLPELRAAIASCYDALGLPTEPDRSSSPRGRNRRSDWSRHCTWSPDRSAIEEPSFRGAIQSLKALGARLVGVPTGPRGIDVDALAATLSKVRPVLLVLQSTVHNPTGERRSMADARNPAAARRPGSARSPR
jgi:hypothetical protein